MPTFRAQVSCDFSGKQLLSGIHVKKQQGRTYYELAVRLFTLFFDSLVRRAINGEIIKLWGVHELRVDWITGEEFKQRARMGLIDGIEYLLNGFSAARVVIAINTGAVKKRHSVYGGPEIKKLLLDRINAGKHTMRPRFTHAKDYYNEFDPTPYRLTKQQRNKIFTYGLRALCKVVARGAGVNIRTKGSRYSIGTIFKDQSLAYQRMLRTLRTKIMYLDSIFRYPADVGYLASFNPLNIQNNQYDFSSDPIRYGIYKNYDSCRLKQTGVRYIYKINTHFEADDPAIKKAEGLVVCELIGRYAIPRVEAIMQMNKKYATKRN